MKEEVYIILLFMWLGFMSVKAYFDFIRPILIKKNMKEVEKNPKWLTPVIRSQYYGLDDVDVILVENKYGVKPQFRAKVVNVNKEKRTKEVRLELLLPTTITTNEIDEIAKIALIGKLCIKIRPELAILYANKPAYWLSILNYMLDGGNINQSAVSWKEKE